MGFAAGFQVGAQAVERGIKMRDEENQRKEFERIQNAAPELTQGALTPDQQAQIDQARQSGYEVIPQTNSQGLITGYGYAGPATNPEAGGFVSPSAGSVKFLGQAVQGELTPERMQGLRYNAMADVVAKQDPARAFQMRQEAARMQREAEEAPLRLQGLRQQVDLGAQNLETGTLTLAEKKRNAEAAERMNNFNTAFGEASAVAEAEGRTLTANDIAKLAKDNKLSYSQENELIASQVGRAESEVKQFRLDVEKLTQGKSYEQLIDLHKNDKRFGDGVHFVSEVDKKTGKHILARVNEATGQVEERLPFKSKAEATAYLMEEARNPANAAIWLQNYQKGAAGIAAQEAAAKKDTALAGLYAQGGKGAGKPSATESLVKEAEGLVTKGVYKDTATAIEALKKGAARDADKEAWLKAEQKLIENDATPEAIQAQRTAFFVRRGYAPAAARQVLETGVNPATGKPLTKADVDAYNATYPQTPVDLGSLPWLPSPEREARRQGLISQIPK